MIVSDLESLFVRVILGGVTDAYQRGTPTPEVDALVEGFLDQISQPGTSAAAELELAETPHDPTRMTLAVPCFCPACTFARVEPSR